MSTVRVSTTNVVSPLFQWAIAIRAAESQVICRPVESAHKLWLDQLLNHLPQVQLTLLVGQYAQSHFLGLRRKSTLTENVRTWRDYKPTFLPLPHPSGRNNAW